MPDDVIGKLREIAEKKTIINGLYSRPSDWESQGPDDIWDSLHRMITCVGGVSAWTKQCVTPPRRNPKKSIFCLDCPTHIPDGSSVKKARGTAVSSQRVALRKRREKRFSAIDIFQLFTDKLLNDKFRSQESPETTSSVTEKTPSSNSQSLAARFEFRMFPKKLSYSQASSYAEWA
jgi:hypothetical protein